MFINIFLLTGVILSFSLLFVYFGYFLLMRKHCKRGPNWKRESNSKKVSLIVATYNEESTLPAKLENVLELNYPQELLELVIIDSGSTDKTPKIVDDFIKENPSLKILFLREDERLGKTHALNIAYPKASGEIKIISDSDAILEKDALKNIVSNFSDGTIGGACGRQILLNPDENPSTKSEKAYRNIYQILREGESFTDSTPIFHGELSAYRSNLIEPLPENKSADDSRMANIIRKKGFRCVYDSKAIFYEYAPSTFNGRIVQKVRRGQGLIRVFWDFKDSMFRKRNGFYGMVSLPIEFFIHCVFPTLSIFSLFLLLFGTLIFSLPLFVSVLALAVCVYGLSKLNTDNVILGKLKAFSNLVMTFIISQFFLFYALILWVSGRSLHKWKKVDDVRENYNPTSFGR